MLKSFNQNIPINYKGIALSIKRDDLLHPEIPGNKYRKLKYNLKAAKAQSFDTLLTFGGAYSNHIAAVAAAGKEHGFNTIGIIRGEELLDKINENPTLKFAVSCGMQLEFISREAYRNKSSNEFIDSLKTKFGRFFLLPEGGTNDLAVKGCEELLTGEDFSFDYICCAVGTGGTLAGIANSAADNQKVLGFQSLAGDFLSDSVRKFSKRDNWMLIDRYTFGGYGKIDANLVNFINSFSQDYSIPLDPIYTGKMVFGVMDLINQGFFPEGSKILMIHTGGLQGIEGMNRMLKNKNLPTIEI